MCKSVEGVDGLTGKTLDWVRWVSQVAVIPLLAFMLVWILNIDRSVTAMTANRYTSGDHAKHLSEMNGQMTSIWKELASLRVAMANLPPEEFEAKVNAIEKRLRAVELEQARRR